jgi:hypothetical protein
MICGTPKRARILPMQRDTKRSVAGSEFRIRSVGINFTEVHHLAWLNWQQDGCPAGFDMEYYVAAESLLMGRKRPRTATSGRKDTGDKWQGDGFDPTRPPTAHARSFPNSSQRPEPTAGSRYPEEELLEREQSHETS